MFIQINCFISVNECDWWYCSILLRWRGRYKNRLTAVSHANELIQETGCANLKAGYGAIVMRISNVIRRVTKDTINITLKSVGTKQYISIYEIIARLRKYKPMLPYLYFPNQLTATNIIHHTAPYRGSRAISAAVLTVDLSLVWWMHALHLQQFIALPAAQSSAKLET
jgi:hypothetical protein